MPSNCSRRTVADRRTVERAHRHDAAGRGGQENLVAGPECGLRQGLDPRLDVEAVGQLQRGPPRDALEHAGVRRRQHAVLVGEDVDPRPFRDIALVVGQHGDLGAALGRLEQGTRQVAPLVVLDGLVERGHGHTPGRGDDQVDAGLLVFGPGDPDERDGIGIEPVAAIERVALARRQGSAGRGDVDVKVLETGERREPMQYVRHVVRAVAQVEPHLVAAFAKPLQMHVQPEEPAIPDMNHVIGRVGPGEAEIEQRNARLADWAELAVEV